MGKASASRRRELVTRLALLLSTDADSRRTTVKLASPEVHSWFSREEDMETWREPVEDGMAYGEVAMEPQ